MLDAREVEIRTLSEGEKIEKPGFYAIPIEQHHSQPTKGISVTSSILRTMTTHSPEQVWAFSHLNPNRYERQETKALREGKAMAALIEGGPEKLEDLCRVLPADKPNRPTAAQVKAYKEGRPTEAGLRSIAFWRDVDSDPRTIITEAEWDLITQMGRALAADPIASACLRGVPEVTMAWHDEETDLWVLSRPDILTFDGLLSDYKKISLQGSAMTGYLVDGRITKHRYDMQMSLAVEAFHKLTGHWCDTTGLVFQSDTPPYSAMMRGFTDQDIRIGIHECRKQRFRFRECLDAGHWPGPGEIIENYIRPAKQLEAYMEEMA